MHRVRVVVGDWSHDGHCQADGFDFEVNLYPTEVRKRVEATIQKYGLDEVCHYYQDSSVPKSLITRVKEEFPDFDPWSYFEFEEDSEPEDEEYRCTYPEYWACFVMWLTSKNYPELVCWLANPPHADRIHIGGYGLYE